MSAGSSQPSPAGSKAGKKHEGQHGLRERGKQTRAAWLKARALRRRDAERDDAANPSSRLRKADLLLLGLGIVVAGSGLAAIATAGKPVCSSKTTTDTVFANDPSHPSSGKRTVVESCSPVKATAGYPEAALIVGAVLVVPAISRRVAEGFEANLFGNKVSKSATPSAAEVRSALDDEVKKDPRA